MFPTPLSKISVAALLCLGAFTLSSSGLALAQVAGSTTTMDTHVSETTQVAMGWSVKKTLMGKTIYNDAGDKVGKVEDLIIAPDRNVSYLIVGAGGFVGIGRHDVAIAISQVQDKGGKLVLPGATKDSIKALPEFTYANDTSKRDQFVAAADRDIAKAKLTLSDLEKKAGNASAEAKTKLDLQATALKEDIQSAEAKLAELKQATAVRWRDFETNVNTATQRLRKSVDKALG